MRDHLSLSQLKLIAHEEKARGVLVLARLSSLAHDFIDQAVIDNLFIGEIDVFTEALAHELECDLKLALREQWITQCDAVFVGRFDHFGILQSQVLANQAQTKFFVSLLLFCGLYHPR